MIALCVVSCRLDGFAFEDIIRCNVVIPSASNPGFHSKMKMRIWLRRFAHALYPKIRIFVPKSVRNLVYALLYQPHKRKDVVIDVVGFCNLSCPSCPVGNMEAKNPKDLIDLELFEKIMKKLSQDYEVYSLSLFNWAEPNLHPKLPELVKIVKKYKLPCGLSSNLNLLRRVDDIFLAEPDFFRVSVSGFTQPVYGITHKRGNIETVKKNMKILSEAVKRTGSKVHLEAYYHKYTHNLHEIALMKEYALGLGYHWQEDWAYYMPLEKTLDLVDGKLSSEESKFVEQMFALPISKAIDVARDFKDEPCRLYTDQIALDLQGNMLTCCAVYDFDKNRLGNFLEMTPQQIEHAKDGNQSCAKCQKHGLHAYFGFQTHPRLKPLYEELAVQNLDDMEKRKTG